MFCSPRHLSFTHPQASPFSAYEEHDAQSVSTHHSSITCCTAFLLNLLSARPLPDQTKTNSRRKEKRRTGLIKGVHALNSASPRCGWHLGSKNGRRRKALQVCSDLVILPGQTRTPMSRCTMKLLPKERHATKTPPQGSIFAPRTVSREGGRTSAGGRRSLPNASSFAFLRRLAGYGSLRAKKPWFAPLEQFAFRWQAHCRGL